MLFRSPPSSLTLPPSLPSSPPAIWLVWLTEFQVLAGACGALLGAQGEPHGLDLLTEGVERAVDLLHALCARQEVFACGVGRAGLGIGLGEHLGGIDGTLGLPGDLDGEWLDDVAWGALIGRGRGGGGNV